MSDSDRLCKNWIISKGHISYADNCVAPSWSNIPTALLQAELDRRQDEAAKPACGSGKKGSYNTPAHVFALILILALSTIACGYPLVSRRSSNKKGPNKFVFLSQHFGTGVLIATAFVHLLPTAFVSLTDPCLPWLWIAYKPMAGFIAMVSALTVVGIEMFLRTRGAGHSHSRGDLWIPISTSQAGEAHNHRLFEAGTNKSYRQGKPGASQRPQNIALEDVDDTTQRLVETVSPYSESTRGGNGSRGLEEPGGDKDSDLDLDLDELDPSADIQATLGTQAATSLAVAQEERKKLMLQCLMLEAGILFHSVFIGMAISVATGTPFIVFLIAIAFHQSFEGLALGSRIANINFPKSSPRPWIMVLAYGTTTPIGQAIGLVVHKMYDPLSETGLLMVGIMNAISSGLLLFAGLVQLLAEDFLTDKSYEVLNGKSRVQAFIAVLSGASLMALVGAWA
ncbi:MAG: hypothetical protein M1818_006779 [Claussenomyces sp. TS43310]|nr:MAG: hypothetical protein M1818_006779 [Claussenomyces sp. TS43310]